MSRWYDENMYDNKIKSKSLTIEFANDTCNCEPNS